MAQNEAGSTAASADRGSLDAAIRQIEKSIDNSAKKLDASLIGIAGVLVTNFKSLEDYLIRWEIKLDRAVKALVAIEAKSKETESSLVLFMEGIDQFLRGERVEGGRKMYSALYERRGDEEMIGSFRRDDPDQLLDRFKKNEGDIAKLKVGGITEAEKILIEDIRHEQELILVALKRNAEAFRSLIESYEGISSNPGQLKNGSELMRARDGFDAARRVVESIEKLGTGLRIPEIIDRGRPELDQSSQQTGARGASPLDHQVATAGGPTIYPGSDPAERSLERHAEKLDETAQGYVTLTEVVDRFTAQGGSLTAVVEGINGGLDLQSAIVGVLRREIPDLAEAVTGFFGESIEGAEDLDRAVEAMGTSFLDAFEGAIVRGESLSDVLKGLGQDLLGLALNEVKTTGISGILDSLGGIFGGGTLANAKGNVFAGGQSLTAFVQGGAFSGGRSLANFARGGALTNSIVNRPTLFPMANGAGLMGEAGEEAVVPLTRMANGVLGVSMLGAPAAGSGGTVNVTINAPGASLEGLRIVAAEVRELKAYTIQVSKSIEPRAINAINWRRSRGPW